MAIACKGDWPFLHKAGNLERTFYNGPKGPKSEKECVGVCHKCSAGQPNVDYEDIGGNPNAAWKRTTGVNNRLPWTREPSLLCLPCSRSDAASFFLYDIWHNFHLGPGKNFTAGGVALCSEIVPGRGVDARLAFLSQDFKSWAKNNHISLMTSELSRATLNWDSYAVPPVGVWSKGAHTTHVCLWLESFLTRPENLQAVQGSAKLSVLAACPSYLDLFIWLPETNS